jgi:hypothetical protein
MNTLQKLALAFLAGLATSTAAVMAADGRAAFMLVLGVVLTLGTIALILSSRTRLRHAGEILVGLADTLDRKPTSAPTASKAATATPIFAPDRHVIDIQSALVNFGMKKKDAETAAAAAVAQGGDFDQMLTRAMKSVGRAA